MSYSPIILLLAVAAVVYLFLQNGIEHFVSAVPIEVTMEQYAQDIRVVASYVGPYIGEIYNYLRAMYTDPSNPSSIQSFSYQPALVTDRQLQDPLLPIARTQVKAWIDSAKTQIMTRYGEAFVNGAKKQHDLKYEMQSNGVLSVILIKDGEAQTYML